MAGNSSAPGASVTSRALGLIGAFDEEHRRLSLTSLAERADLPLPTAHRLVGELVDKVTSVAPEREVRIGLGGVEGRASALLVVVVV